MRMRARLTKIPAKSHWTDVEQRGEEEYNLASDLGQGGKGVAVPLGRGCPKWLASKLAMNGKFSLLTKGIPLQYQTRGPALN